MHCKTNCVAISRNLFYYHINSGGEVFGAGDEVIIAVFVSVTTKFAVSLSYRLSPNIVCTVSSSVKPLPVGLPPFLSVFYH